MNEKKWPRICYSRNCCNFAALDSATLPADQRTRAELFLSIHTMSYTKRPLDTPDIIHTLKERGLAIADEKRAVEFLNHVSYLLRAYTNVDTKAMGFPENWETEPLWN